jgi:hypothetical protein
MDFVQTAQKLVPGACEDLLVAIGHRPRRCTGRDASALIAHCEDHAAGVIHFAGEAMTGSLVLLSAYQFFAASLPRTERGTSAASGSATDWIRVRDLSMELSNQLLGRIRNGLCRYGVIVDPTLPRAVSGAALRVVVRQQTQEPHVYLGGTHEVFVWFQAVARGPAATGTRGNVIAEGDFVEF